MNLFGFGICSDMLQAGLLACFVFSEQVLQFLLFISCAGLLDCYIFSFVPLTAFYSLPKLQNPTSLSFSLHKSTFLLNLFYSEKLVGPENDDEIDKPACL